MTLNTYIKIYSKQDDYIKGVGTESNWKYEGRLFCHWQSSYGKRVFDAKAIGAIDTATVHTYFHPAIFEILQTHQCLVIKNGTKDEYVAEEVEEPFLNAYTLLASVENIKEAGKEMEFMVERYLAK